MDEAILSVQNLSVEFSGDGIITKAVNDISFELRRGEILGIVGESGSGKSVTSLSILRLIQSPPGKITQGKIVFSSSEHSDVELLSVEEKEMQQFRGNRISMIFQEPMTSLNPVFTCGFQVMESLIFHKKMTKNQAKEETLRLFEEVKLPDPEQMLKKYPHQISGGQKQRVMIAMALCCSPDILIADEPTTALDVTVQASILQLLKRLQEQRKMSIIFITHDLGVIAEIADRVAVMYQGKIVETGVVKNIFKNPQHPYTKGLLACRPPLNKRLKRLPVISDFMTIENSGRIKTEPVEIQDSETNKRRKLLEEKNPILEVKNLSSWFAAKKSWLGNVKQWTRSVDDVSFRVYPGETLGLVGESGCGKTTLGRSILRLIEPRNGQIIFNSKNISSYNHSEMIEIRKQMQIVFQDPYSSLNPRMTIGTAITEPMKVHGIFSTSVERREKAIELMEKVGLLPEYFNRYPHEFSGGQRQRICIARALAVNPKFLICDESVSALDVSIQAQVLNLLMQLREEFGLTYIFISHDLSVVRFMSDRIMVMNQGKIEEQGGADEIYFNPKSPYTQKLIQAIPKGIC